jgi:predicted aldo/keto reductase-like oxidoreductase
MSISRREFLGTTAVGLASTALTGAESGSPLIPTRTLGKTGARVSSLAMGGGSRFLMIKDEDKAIAAVGRALDLGITYIDTSDDYGNNHDSEQRIGKALKGRRKSVFLATKLSNRNGEDTRRIVETSLKSLQVDQLDLIHIHSLTSNDDLASIESKGGVLEQLTKLRDQKLTRFIGITSHTDPAVLKAALERHDFDCTQMALNAAMVGMRNGRSGMVPNEEMKTSFETLALPVAVKKNMGIIAMKVFAQDALLSTATPEKLMYYSLSLPVAAVVIGMPKMEHLEDNVRLAKAFKPLPKSEMKHLSSTISAQHKVALDRFFATHVDA